MSLNDAWRVSAAAIEDPEFLVAAFFCALGLCLTLCFINLCPAFGEIAQSLAME